MLLLKLKYPHKALLLLTLGFIIVASFVLAWFFFGDMKYFFYDGLIILGVLGFFELYLRIQHNVDTKYESLKAHLVLKEEFFAAQKDIAVVLKNLTQFLQKSELPQKLEQIHSQQKSLQHSLEVENITHKFSELKNTVEQEASSSRRFTEEETKRISELLSPFRNLLITFPNRFEDIQAQQKKLQSAIHSDLEQKTKNLKKDLASEIQQNSLETANAAHQDVIQVVALLEKLEQDLTRIIQEVPEADLTPLAQQIADTAAILRQDVTNIDFTPLSQQLSDVASILRQDVENIDFSPLAQQISDSAAVIREDIETIDFSPLSQQIADSSAIIRQDIEMIDFSPLAQQISDSAAVIRQDIELIPPTDLTPISEQLADCAGAIRQDIAELPDDNQELIDRINALEEELKGAIETIPPTDLKPILKRFEFIAVEIKESLHGLPDREFSALSHRFDVVDAELQKLAENGGSIEAVTHTSETMEKLFGELSEKIEAIAEIEIDWSPIAQNFETLRKQLQHYQQVSKNERLHVSNVFESLKNRTQRLHEDISTLSEAEKQHFTAHFQVLQKQIQKLEQTIPDKTTPHPKLEQYLTQNYEFQKGVVQVLETMEAEIQKYKKKK